MKRMRNWSWTGLVLAILAMGMSSCCNSPKEYHYPLKPEALNLSQYNPFSTFRMQHSAGRIESFSVLNLGHEEVEVSSCSNCCAKEFKDLYYVLFTAETQPLQVKVELSQAGAEGTYSPAKLGITINENGIFYADLLPGGLCGKQTGLQCFDTLSIGSNLYEDVFEFENQGTSHTPEVAKSLFFNGSHGLLKFSTFDGATWELLD